jgi:hypothetical protein
VGSAIGVIVRRVALQTRSSLAQQHAFTGHGGALAPRGVPATLAHCWQVDACAPHQSQDLRPDQADQHDITCHR